MSTADRKVGISCAHLPFLFLQRDGMLWVPLSDYVSLVRTPPVFLRFPTRLRCFGTSISSSPRKYLPVIDRFDRATFSISPRRVAWANLFARANRCTAISITLVDTRSYKAQCCRRMAALALLSFAYSHG